MGTKYATTCWCRMENHASDRVLLIEDDPIVRLMAVLAQYAEEHAALAAGQTMSFDPGAPSFAAIFDR